VSPDPTDHHRYLAPRFWPTWVGLGLLRLIWQLPYRLRLAVGRLLGRVMWLLLPRRRRVVAVNLALCFPQLTPAERRRLVRAHFRSAGMGLVEAAMCWWSSDEALAPLAQFHGLEHLDAAAAAGRGVILFSGHVTPLEIGGRLVALKHPLVVMYKSAKDPLFESVLKRSRERHAARAIQRHDVRGLIRSLKEGLVCWYAPDQDFGRKNALFAPFFGIPTATVTATSRFAQTTGAPVVPFFPARRADGRGYDLFFLPALEGFPSGDDLADTSRLNGLLEAHVRRYPEQYIWLHRRFKTRPEGEPDPYR